MPWVGGLYLRACRHGHLMRPTVRRGGSVRRGRKSRSVWSSPFLSWRRGVLFAGASARRGGDLPPALPDQLAVAVRSSQHFNSLPLAEDLRGPRPTSIELGGLPTVRSLGLRWRRSGDVPHRRRLLREARRQRR